MLFTSLLEHLSLREYLIALSAVLITVFLLSSLLPRWRFYSKYRNLPPGPFCWPIIGYAPFLNIKTAPLSLKREADKYGGMFGIFIGKKYALVIDDVEILKEAFKREEFSYRDPDLSRHEIDSLYKAQPLLSGSEWYEQRRIWKHAVRNVFGNQAVRSELEKQILLVGEAVEATEGRDVDLDGLLEVPLTNFAAYMGFGKTYEAADRTLEQHIQFVHSFVFYFASILFCSLFSQSRWLITILPSFRQAKQVLMEEDKLLRYEISILPKSADQNEPQTFVDYYHNEIRKFEQEEAIILATLVGNSAVFLAELVEGVFIPMKWLLLLLACHPEVQNKIQSEIDCIVGQQMEPLPTDRAKMPLLEASFVESVRMKYIFRFQSFRSVSKDTTLRGYDIPKETMVIFNIRPHFNNPKLWKDPERFDPYRFLSEDGKTLHVPEHFIPFSYGKRQCLGQHVVNSLMYTIVGSILQRFRILPPEGGVNLKASPILIRKPEYPFVKFQKRSVAPNKEEVIGQM